MHQEPIICLIGPTAVGKSDFALEIASELNAEIISVDSSMVYRGLNIGSAKPSPEQLASVPHHLIDIREAGEIYSAGDFKQDVDALIPQIWARNRRPILVGGTMMYWHVLFHGLADLPKADLLWRQNIEKQAQEQGWPALHAQLMRLDPERAQQIHPNDGSRIQRALEIIRATGSMVSQLWNQPSVTPFSWWPIQLVPADRDWLRERIARRFEQMLDQGFIEEVQYLLKEAKIDEHWVGWKAVGYRQVLHYLKGEYTKSELLERGIIATRQLAKRQLVWLKRYTEGVCVRADQPAAYTLKSLKQLIKTALAS